MNRKNLQFLRKQTELTGKIWHWLNVLKLIPNSHLVQITKLVDDWQVSDKADKPQKWHGRINNNIAQNAERLHSNKRTVFEV